MPPREQFIKAFEHELVGLLVIAYHNAQRLPKESHAHGKFFDDQVQGGRELLGKIYDKLADHLAKDTNGKPLPGKAITK